MSSTDTQPEPESQAVKANTFKEWFNEKISFVVTEGLAITPIANTCGPRLEISSTYQVHNEMVEEFNNILRLKKSWT